MLRDADALSFADIEKGVGDFAARARDGKLEPTAEVSRRGTFGRGRPTSVVTVMKVSASSTSGTRPLMTSFIELRLSGRLSHTCAIAPLRSNCSAWKIGSVPILFNFYGFGP